MNEGLINASKDAIQNRLLVEGSDDANVCYHLLTRHRINVVETIKIVDKKGVDELLATLDVELLTSKARNIGIIVDADENQIDRWKSLVDILIESGYQEVPNAPTWSGTIIREQNKPSVGIWLMPDNELPGMLEHFCSFLVPTEDSLWKFADEVVKRVIEIDRRFPPNHIMKAHIHTWLAWQREPGKPMGQAITKRYLDHTSPYAQQFIAWICQLFDISANIDTLAL
jgi:uncharacterized protein DUF3226